MPTPYAILLQINAYDANQVTTCLHPNVECPQIRKMVERLNISLFKAAIFFLLLWVKSGTRWKKVAISSERGKNSRGVENLLNLAKAKALTGENVSHWEALMFYRKNEALVLSFQKTRNEKMRNWWPDRRYELKSGVVTLTITWIADTDKIWFLHLLQKGT